MHTKRIIPILLLKNSGLVKTVQFKNPKYIGDPINAVKIFNDKYVDELYLLDISARSRKSLNIKLLEDISGEAFMPLGYGGGINTLDDSSMVFSIGFEKVVINTACFDNYELISSIANKYGSQSIVAAIDINKNFLGEYVIYSNSGTKKETVSLANHLKNLISAGAGEIFLNTIYKDGTMSGYDNKLIGNVVKQCNLPVVACGGAGSNNDFLDCFKQTNVSAVSAGSKFVFHGPHRAVLINYPNATEIKDILNA